MFAGPTKLAPGTWPLKVTGLPIDTSTATPATAPFVVSYRVEDPQGRVATAERKVGACCVIVCQWLQCE